MRFLGRAARLAVVARLAGGHHVLPVMAAPAMPGQNMVQRQVSRLLPAVLTGKAIAQENVATGKTPRWPGSADEVDQPDYRRDLEDRGWTVKVSAAVLNDLGLATVDQYESAPDVADV